MPGIQVADSADDAVKMADQVPTFFYSPGPRQYRELDEDEYDDSWNVMTSWKPDGEV